MPGALQALWTMIARGFTGFRVPYGEGCLGSIGFTVAVSLPCSSYFG